MIKKLYNYAVSITGQVSQAAFNFGLFFILIGILNVSDLGLYSFIMMITGLSGSLCNAACATQVTIYQDPLKRRKTGIYDKMFCQVNSLLSIGVGIVAAITAMCIYHNVHVGIPIFLFNALFFIRHFKRAYEFAKLRHQMATVTDLIYVVIGAILLFIYHRYIGELTIPSLFTMLSFALFCSIVIGKDFLRIFFSSFDRSYLVLYRKIWKSDTRWNLLGATTGEITANIHSYLIMGIKGSAAFAPVTASQMPYRGIGIIQTALSGFERPRLVTIMKNADKKELKSVTYLYYGFVLFILFSLIAAVSFFWDEIFIHVYKSKFDKEQLYHMFMVWGVVFFVRCFSSFTSLELQAMRAFEQLGKITGLTAVISTVASLTLLLTFGTTASIFGILLSESVVLYALRRKRNQVMKTFFSGI